MSHVLLVQGDARAIPLADASVECCVTSPPYFALRSYGIGKEYGEIGQEPLHDCLAWARQEPPCGPPQCWICAMRVVFAEVWRVMRPEATLWINCGDAYNAHPGQRSSTDKAGPKQQTNGGSVAIGSRNIQSLPAKSLLGLPWRLALALQADGFILRAELIWHKLNPMPESVLDRPTRAHEQVFLFSKQGRYYYDGEAVREAHTRDWSGSIGTQNFKRQPDAREAATGLYRNGSSHQGILDAVPHPNGRACRTVWSLASEPLSMSHFATFPTALVRRCLLAGAPTQVCSACGKPWVRVREVVRSWRETAYAGVHAYETVNRTARVNSGGMSQNVYADGDFSPSCACVAPTRPGIAFDPFVGSGTTLQVARELGLHGVGTDLSWPYLATIARERLGLADLHRWTHGATPQPVTYADLPLFAED